MAKLRNSSRTLPQNLIRVVSNNTHDAGTTRSTYTRSSATNYRLCIPSSIKYPNKNLPKKIVEGTSTKQSWPRTRNTRSVRNQQGLNKSCSPQISKDKKERRCSCTRYARQHCFDTSLTLVYHCRPSKRIHHDAGRPNIGKFMGYGPNMDKKTVTN